MTPEQFIGRIVHDLRAPLRSLGELPTWAMEDLQDAGVEVPEDVAETLDMMVSQANRMGVVVEGLGRFARITPREAPDVRPIADVLAELTLPEGLELQLALETVPLDREDLSFILSEIFRNSEKHNPGRSCRLRMIAAEKDGAAWVLVEDDGAGVPEAELERVFDPLTGLRPRDEIEGAGMGLAVIRRIVETSGGQVRLLPEPSLGGCSVAIRLRLGAS